MDIVTISDAQATVKIATSGGLITSYTLADGFEIMRTSQSEGSAPPEPRKSASFPLIPYSNRIKNGTFIFEGKSYTLPLNFGDHPHSLHGIGWTSQWDILAATDTEVTLCYTHNGDNWPFRFEATQRFSLNNGALFQEISIRNSGSSAMPAGLGLHPYFPRHNGARLQAELPHVWMTTDTGIPTERIKTPSNWPFAKGVSVASVCCDHVFEKWNSLANINWPEQHRSLQISAHPDLDRLVVYIPENENYFCVEPVSHITDAFNLSEKGMPLDESGMRVLAPREYWKVWVRFTPS